MTAYEALLAALGRTPEEDRAFWFECQRREYDRFWSVEDGVNHLRALGAEDDESAGLVARAFLEQQRIYDEQSERGEIRDRITTQRKRDEHDNQ